MPIHWRSQRDIDEENRFGPQYDPNRVVEVNTLNCLDCGGEITEIRFADGRKSYDTYGVTNIVGEGVRHSRCVREDDLRHDADWRTADTPEAEAERTTFEKEHGE